MLLSRFKLIWIEFEEHGTKSGVGKATKLYLVVMYVYTNVLEHMSHPFTPYTDLNKTNHHEACISLTPIGTKCT